MTRRLHPARAWPVVAMAGLILAGCSGSTTAGNNSMSEEPAAEAAEATPAIPTPAPTLPGNDVEANAVAEMGNGSATSGGDGSQIVLNRLSRDEIKQANLSGKIGCGFFAKGEAEPLLFARSDAEAAARAQGMVKVAGYNEAVSASGGGTAMRDGTRFAGKSKTITIRVTGPALPDVQSARPASLTYDRADGASRAVEGLWVCGGG